MDTHGSLTTLRHEFKCYGRTLRVAFFKAAHELNPELEARHRANRVGITRQLRYSTRNENSLDVVLSVNGIERMEQNEEIFARFMNDHSFQNLVASWLVGEVYKRLQPVPDLPD